MNESGLLQILEQKKESVLKNVEPKIKKTLGTIPSEYREDVEQDVKLKIIESVDNVEFSKIPGFFDFINHVRMEGKDDD